MKKNIYTIILIMTVFILTGCSQHKNEKKQIVCTIFPEYDWVINILGDAGEDYEVKLILDGSADLHSYQPTAKDIAVVSTCDMLIYVGGESDEWIEKALENKTNDNMIIINLMDVLGESALEEEMTEGMMHYSENEDGEKDEHVWLSLKNAILFNEYISDELIKMDEVNAESYKINTEDYIDKLQCLDEQYEEAFKTSSNVFIFADRFPFLYMSKEYEFDYYAAFSGCSAESEAGFSTITFLAEKINEEDVSAIFVLENSDMRLAKTIAQASGRELQILTLDSIQSVSREKRENGYTYLNAMEENLRVMCNRDTR